jgi:rubrerythrin
MRNLVSFLAGIGIGFLGARELDRLISEKARLEAVENQSVGGIVIGGGGPIPPGEMPEDQLEERTVTCEVCSETWTEEFPPREAAAQCPNCGQITRIDE